MSWYVLATVVGGETVANPAGRAQRPNVTWQPESQGGVEAMALLRAPVWSSTEQRQSFTNRASKAVIPEDLFAVYRDAIHSRHCVPGLLAPMRSRDCRHQLTRLLFAGFDGEVRRIVALWNGPACQYVWTIVKGQ